VAAVDILNPDTQELLFAAGSLLDEDAVDRIEQLGSTGQGAHPAARAIRATASAPGATP